MYVLDKFMIFYYNRNKELSLCALVTIHYCYQALNDELQNDTLFLMYSCVTSWKRYHTVPKHDSKVCMLWMGINSMVNTVMWITTVKEKK